MSAKVLLSYSDEALRAHVGRSFAAPLNFIFKAVIKDLKKHPRYLNWVDWGKVPTSLGLLICDDATVRYYNREYRKLDKATDVLSFPSIEASAEPAAGMEGYLGDLIISLDTVERAATRVKRPLTEEFVEVYIHGILHLLGFDHVVNKRDAVEMKSKQAELFKSLRAPIKKRYGSFVKKRQRHQRIS